MQEPTASNTLTIRALPICAKCRRAHGNRTRPVCHRCVHKANGQQSSNEPLSRRAPKVGRMNGKEVERMQMFADFYEAKFSSTSVVEAERGSLFSWLAWLPVMDTECGLLKSAVDTLCLAHIGSKHQDDRLLVSSRQSYVKVLNSLMLNLGQMSRYRGSSKVELANKPTNVLMSIHVISLYDECIPLEHREQNNWITHLWGAQQYLGAIGPSYFNLARHRDQVLIRCTHHFALTLGVARRKAMSLGTEAWAAVQQLQQVAVWSKHIFRGFQGWYPVFEPLPGLLEKTDSLLSESRPGPDYQQKLQVLCQELDECRKNVVRFFQIEADEWGFKLGSVDVGDEDKFDMSIEEHVFMTTSDTIVRFHRFADPMHFVLFVWTTKFLLAMDLALLRIFHLRPITRQFHGHRTPQQVDADAFAGAIDLCRSIQYACEIKSLAYAHYQTILLKLSRNFFEEHGDIREAGWCSACLIATELRIRRQNLHTLCRIGSIPNGLVDAGHYKSKTISKGSDCPVSVHHKTDVRTTVRSIPVDEVH